MGKLSFYHDEPLFGLDIGYSSLKLMQLERETGKTPKVRGYGFGSFSPESIKNGVIVEPASLATSLREILGGKAVGSISAKRVACSVPTSHTFSRPMQLPVLDESEVAEAVRLEAEQYIPVPTDNLYFDYEITLTTPQSIYLLMVAIPKPIVDSYLKLLWSLGLEAIALEPSISASSRLFSLVDPNRNKPSIIIDIGSVAIDVAVFDKATSINTTVNGGGETMTDLIAKHLGVSHSEAQAIKTQQGLAASDKQPQIQAALQPILDNLLREVRKTLRYYSEHSGQLKRSIAQLITVGGGSTTPGLNDWLAHELGLPTRSLDPWQQLDFGHLPQVEKKDRAMFLTTAGEAMLNPKEIFVND